MSLLALLLAASECAGLFRAAAAPPPVTLPGNCLMPVVDATGSANLAPPPIASTDTASTTSSLLPSMNPKRDLCAVSKADFIAARERPSTTLVDPAVNAGTTSAVSVPA